MTVPPGSRSAILARSAAGFIATSTWGASPGVKISWLAKLTWKPLTPARVPAGARISAGKSGIVETSLPSTADVLVNWVPVSCIPSPESPANRMATDSSSSNTPSSSSDAGPVALEWVISDITLLLVKGQIQERRLFRPPIVLRAHTAPHTVPPCFEGAGPVGSRPHTSPNFITTAVLPSNRAALTAPIREVWQPGPETEEEGAPP